MGKHQTTEKTPSTRKKPFFNSPSKELVEAAGKKRSARWKNLRSAKDSETIHLSDSAKLLFGDELDEQPSDREDELLKETPVLVPASTQAITPAAATTAQAEDDQQPHLVPIRRSGQRIDSGPDSEEELQLEVEEDEPALEEVALSNFPTKSADSQLL
ncbi:hypothetical protein DAPPUDRAFT_246018 [Daphnia pulex]|uniref:Uncharacterized protein n=1 Tax=Daphnia pulex TaxID=6669 RepID=E9GPH1_DAPPU|nr:hypothetical protein DAPPUDRAFT_246018 [Daphnia pulex]|eukprot:EFX78637.1 hypothetical protein DAPPUDRAFT_246018 [Daphnia pulex]